MAKQYITNGINTSTTRVGVAAEDMKTSLVKLLS